MKKGFTCEICRKAPTSGKWARKWKWKTEKGLLNHLCWKDIKIAQDKQRKHSEEIQKERLSRRVATAEHKINEFVYFASYSVTKPTHKQRGGRSVKVRYEEERSYRNSSGGIDEIAIGGYIINGLFVRTCNVCSTEQEAIERAGKLRNEYKEHCAFSSFVR